MDTPMKEALIEHLLTYLKGYTDRGCTIEAAALNYVREFPARLHLTILALMQET